MSNTERPLSPHVSIYRWPITMTLSILHRLSGVAMSLGLIAFAAWLLQASAGPEQYQYFRIAMASLPGRALLVGWSFAFFLHLGNGIRHLAWDLGYGFEKHQANASAWIVACAAVLLTAAYWMLL
jgi:succinate dehydrogenase cytochrome b subunit